MSNKGPRMVHKLPPAVESKPNWKWITKFWIKGQTAEPGKPHRARTSIKLTADRLTWRMSNVSVRHLNEPNCRTCLKSTSIYSTYFCARLIPNYCANYFKFFWPRKTFVCLHAFAIKVSHSTVKKKASTENVSSPASSLGRRFKGF